jgi:hypothetical protein
MTAPAPKPTFGEQKEVIAKNLQPGYNTIIMAHDKNDVVFVIMNRTQVSGRLKQMEMRMPPESAATIMPDFCTAITKAMNYRIKEQEKMLKEKEEEAKKEEERKKEPMNPNIVGDHDMPTEDKRG